MHILLAYGEGNLTKKLKAALLQAGHQAAVLPEGVPPKARYDVIYQLARDPAQTAEGTRLLLNKARQDRSRLFLAGWRLDDRLYAEAFRFAKTLIEESGRKGEVEATVLNLGRLFGPGVPAADSGALGHLISEFSQGNVLTLYGGGTDSDYYLYLDDAIEGLTLALTQARSGETYSLAPSVPITSEAAAKLLYDLGGGRHEMIFHRGLAASAEMEEVAGKPLPEFKIRTPFHDGIVAILKTAPAAPAARAAGLKLPRLRAPLIKIPRLKLSLPRLPRRWAIALAGMLIVFSPLIYLGGSAAWSAFQLQRAKSLLGQGEFDRAAAAVGSAARSLEKIGRLVRPVRPLTGALEAVAEIGAESETLTAALENLVRSRQGEATEPQSEDDFRRLAAAFSSARNRLSLAWIELEAAGAWQADLLKPLLEEGLRAVEFGEPLARSLFEMLGYEGERSYLLLFQNSAELYPSGGRVGTFAEIDLSSGGIKELKFYNESDFNHLPPSQGKIGTVNLLPDFQDGAQAVIDAFRRGTGKEVQGVIGIDLRFAQELLGIAGPFTLTDFSGQEINSENFFEITTREVETDFFPGTDKKKRFIQALGEGVLAKLFGVGRDKYAAVARLAWESLRGKGILLYFENPAVHLAALESNFAGRIRAAAGDFLYPFDHHSGTKGTVWVKRSIGYRVFNTSREGALRAELKITWKNEGTEAWPGGDYLNKTAALAPRGSKLIEARRGEEDVLDNFLTDTYKDKTRFSLPYKIATYITVPPQGEQTLTLVYDLPKDLDVRQGYALLVQKQPGTVADSFRFEFEEPFGYEASSADLQRADNKLIFEGNLTQDLEFKILIEER